MRLWILVICVIVGLAIGFTGLVWWADQPQQVENDHLLDGVTGLGGPHK